MQKHNRNRWLLTFGLLALLDMHSLSVHAADAARGEAVFSEECSECHSVREGKNKKGPSLFAVVGRQAASVPDAVYSDALKASGISWTTEQLDAYLTSPRQKVPGGKMKYEGLDSAPDRASLLAYLATLH